MRESFDREIAQLERVFELVDRFVETAALDESGRYTVAFVVEELFTNMVKYNAGGSGGIEVALQLEDRTLTIELVDPDAPPFDLDRAPVVNVDAPLAERRPGGLGLHLIRRMVDSLESTHDAGRCTIRATKRLRD